MHRYSPLKGFTSGFQYTLRNDIKYNLVEYFDWALLDKGNYFNSTLSELAPNGQDYSKLRLSANDQYTSGQVWEGFRKNWVWQSGLAPSGLAGLITPPIVGTNHEKPGVSGLWVDAAFYPSETTGDYSHHVDYFNGRVIFDTAIPNSVATLISTSL